MSTHLDAEGTTRQDHYGPDEQPWDVIRRNGWAAEFAAANVLKYLRRTKEPEHSLESAKWYWRELNKLVVERKDMKVYDIWSRLSGEMTDAELAKLQA